MRDAYTIVTRPIVTEKSMSGVAENKYTFEVAKDANKIEIRGAVEKIFNVKVAKVNTVTVKGKSRRVGKFPKGMSPDTKKAYVTLAPGSRIEIFEGV